MAFNPNWRQTPAAIAQGYGRAPASAPPAGHPAAAPVARPASRFTGYVPATGSTMRSAPAATPAARSHPQSQDWFRGDPDGNYSWSDLGRDLRGEFSRVQDDIAAQAAAPTPGEKLQAITPDDIPENAVFDGLDMYGRPIEYNGDFDNPELKALDAQTLTWNNDDGKQDVGFSTVQEDENGNKSYGVQGIGFDTDFQPESRTRDESDPGLPTWGMGYQSTSKEDVLAAVAEPVEIDAERYERMNDRERSAIDFNTLLHQSDVNGDRSALSEALNMDLGDDDQMIAQALTRQLATGAAASGGLQARTAAVTQATRELGKGVEGTTSAWEFDTASQQINDMLNDQLSASTLATQQATTGGYSLQALPKEQAFETMFNDLADADQGEWNATELVDLLQQGGYSPDEFWQWSGDRLARFRQAGGDGTLAPAKNSLSSEEMASRLQIDLGG